MVGIEEWKNTKREEKIRILFESSESNEMITMEMYLGFIFLHSQHFLISCSLPNPFVVEGTWRNTNNMILNPKSKAIVRWPNIYWIDDKGMKFDQGIVKGRHEVVQKMTIQSGW